MKSVCREFVSVRLELLEVNVLLTIQDEELRNRISPIIHELVLKAGADLREMIEE